MNNFDLLKMGFNNLWRKKTRTFLTILGVIIGTTSVVAMMSIGYGMDKSFTAMIEGMGDLTVINVRSTGYGPNGPTKSKQTLDDKAVSKFKEISGVKAVMPVKRAQLKMAQGRMVGSVSVIGVDPKTMTDFGFNVSEGRLLEENDKDAVVFGSQIAQQFYNPRLRDPYASMGRGDKPLVNLISNKLIATTNMDYGERKNNQRNGEDYKPPTPHKIKGVGILEESGGEKDWSAYMNITALERMLKEDEKFNRDRSREKDDNQYQVIQVKVADIEQVATIQQSIKDMGFEASSLQDMLKSMKDQTKMIQAVLGGIGAVSLFVAAIGITNTMIMSIYERTRDIGVMKVLGANLVDIQKLFLLESAMIGLAGGIIGLTFSYLVSLIINSVAGNLMGGGGELSIITLKLGVEAIAFATLIGIISGYLPARRAMNISALKAIKGD